MKVIIAGSRRFHNQELLDKWMDHFLSNRKGTITIISGAARGADRLGEDYARARGYQLSAHPADWSKHGRSAGYKRNQEMANEADALVAFWDGKSRGTQHMINIMKDLGKPYRVVKY